MPSQEKEHTLTEAPVNTLLVKMAAPISLGMISTFLFQIVDTYFVGLLGPAELAALTFASNAYLVLVSIYVGFSVGVSSVVAKAIGAGKKERARVLTSLALSSVLILSILLSIAGVRTMDPLFAVLGAQPETLPLIASYMNVLYLGLPFLMIGIIGGGALRAIGITRDTEIVFAIAGVVNLLFDYILIFGIGPFPALGITGAAWATVLSFLFIFGGVGTLLVRNRLLSASGLNDILKDLREIFAISLPAIFMQILTPVTAVFTTLLLARYGPDTVAAFGVASRIEALALVGISAISMAATPFVAQNFGAGKHGRIDEAIVFAGKASLLIGLCLFIVLALAGSHIAKIFTRDPGIVEFVSLYFRIVALSYGFQGIVNVTAAVFNGLQAPLSALKLMFVRTALIVLPALAIGSLFGPLWILIALCAANILAAGYARRLLMTSATRWNHTRVSSNPVRDISKGIRKLLQR
ncbi:MATE family efflux transporter [Roseibium sp. SCP14]|uniref:MATE family efflux transporter n=1 Tax=Roseibium sp. SCP14 TaxID=3141375 RepID=UPI00333988A2